LLKFEDDIEAVEPELHELLKAALKGDKSA